MVNMWTPQQKVQCVLWLAEEKSGTTPCSSYMDRWIDAVYQRGRANTLEKLRQRITNAAARVTPQMPQNNWRKVEYRLDVCRATQGAHIQLHSAFYETRRVFTSSYVKQSPPPRKKGRRVVVLGYAVISSNGVKFKPYTAFRTHPCPVPSLLEIPFAVRYLDGSSEIIFELCSSDNSRQKVEV
ncbi:hypothetical protein ANN_23523 [Periplaneta americana]|uniref:Uncharacterized protein n=1 Tax=Periplaneta americana TaxID=6978 RepID=A0ABQ8SLB3_PERAM|nr:hypothetical protein ANN_23523 [Periplaneta americana]